LAKSYNVTRSPRKLNARAATPYGIWGLLSSREPCSRAARYPEREQTGAGLATTVLQNLLEGRISFVFDKYF